ncbi:exodeoxyribonuclease VII large subunit [Algicola sagamiensis]|uniref:exodeoxyribonuclease VII large subunit n=1 Tax=Algicola sagamiensis TaxID=163869 RepID=UPI00037092AB|nr:exodeoxyribonuclease VII large subunit [Algicola sagamiensis]
MRSNTRAIFSVTQLNKQVKQLLEIDFAGIWVTGEISNFVCPGSGHWYFTLKDEKAQVRAAMFRSQNARVSFPAQNGVQVLARGRLSLYEPRGDYQFIVETMEPAGDGLLRQQFEALKAQLAAEGFFNTAYKKPLPSSIQRVGVITSPTGAAIKDILSVLQRRAPQLEVVIYPAQVQGQEAPQQLIHALQTANLRQEVDVILLGRGGGSLEDLWCFNDEQLARAIFQSDIPVISAVGHEIDVTISDYVADIRAATPSAAAELVSPDNQHLQQKVILMRNRLNVVMSHRLQVIEHEQRVLLQRLASQHPNYQLEHQAQKLDELCMRFRFSIQKLFNQKQQRSEHFAHRLHAFSPQQQLEQLQLKQTHLQLRLDKAMKQQLVQKQHQWSTKLKQLDIVSPLATIARGYSITFDQQQKVVRETQQVLPGEQLRTRVSDGEIISEVTQVMPI